MAGEVNSVLDMYIMTYGKQKRYAFGEELTATRMWVDDYGFKTPEKAFEDYKKEHPEFKGELKDYWRGGKG